MNEAEFVFAKEGSLVEVPYVEPLFWGVLMSSPWFQGLMEYERIIWTTWYDMCCLQNDKFDDACYTHGMTFLIQIWKVHCLS